MKYQVVVASTAYLNFWKSIDVKIQVKIKRTKKAALGFNADCLLFCINCKSHFSSEFSFFKLAQFRPFQFDKNTNLSGLKFNGVCLGFYLTQIEL